MSSLCTQLSLLSARTNGEEENKVSKVLKDGKEGTVKQRDVANEAGRKEMKSWERAIWETINRKEDKVISEGSIKVQVGCRESGAFSETSPSHGAAQKRTSTSCALN